jgi:hypothetical protein
MSQKARFQVMLELEQLEAMRAIGDRTGAPIARQIRMALSRWLAQQAEQKTDRKRAGTRKRL